MATMEDFVSSPDHNEVPVGDENGVVVDVIRIHSSVTERRVMEMCDRAWRSEMLTGKPADIGVCMFCGAEVDHVPDEGEWLRCPVCEYRKSVWGVGKAFVDGCYVHEPPGADLVWKLSAAEVNDRHSSLTFERVLETVTRHPERDKSCFCLSCGGEYTAGSEPCRCGDENQVSASILLHNLTRQSPRH